ncbi:MAG: hypothetical protein OES84_01260 [Kiritimatiellaceae bacterium]|nr:hypothetical protein [Kiritimatiellaceae bacterium]
MGDEAILECIIGIFCEVCPQANITVDNPRETAERLGVGTVPIFGFAPPYNPARMRECIAKADVFVWAGATGLSDYPEIPLSLLKLPINAAPKPLFGALV